MFLRGQSLHEGAKLIAAIRVAFEHVEGRLYGRKENNFAGPRYCVGAFDCIASEVAISDLTTPLQERLMLSAISPIKTVDLTLPFTRDRSGSK